MIYNDSYYLLQNRVRERIGNSTILELTYMFKGRQCLIGENKMKNNPVIVLMLILLFALIARLVYLNQGVEPNTSKLVTWEDLDELAIFVTLENEVERNFRGDITVEDTTVFQNTVSASVTLTVNDGKTDNDISRSPDYVSLYPSLYTTPLKGQRSPSDGRKVCYLTFDDGPSDNTWKILDILDEKGIKATFFVVGESMSDKEVECLKEIVSRGHTIGIHTYHHDYKSLYKSVNSFLKDYEKVYDMVVEATGVKPNIYRFPGGSYNMYAKKIRKELILEMERRGFTHYDWNVTGEDSVGTPSAYSIKKNIKKDIFRFQCPVVLLHDASINDITASILPGIIDDISEKGYEFDTLDQREPCQFSW